MMASSSQPVIAGEDSHTHALGNFCIPQRSAPRCQYRTPCVTCSCKRCVTCWQRACARTLVLAYEALGESLAFTFAGDMVSGRATVSLQRVVLRAAERAMLQLILADAALEGCLRRLLAAARPYGVASQQSNHLCSWLFPYTREGMLRIFNDLVPIAERNRTHAELFFDRRHATQVREAVLLIAADPISRSWSWLWG